MFENIITLAAESEQTTLKEFAAKHPELKRFYDLGEKAAALEPKLQTLKYKGVDQIDQAITELEQHRAWKEKDWPTWNTIHTNLETAFTTAQSKIAELEARTETDMTPEEIRQVVKEALADTLAQIAAAKQDGIKEGQKLAREAAGSGQRGVPVDGKGSTSRLGPLQRKALEKYKADTDGQTKAPLGKGIIASQQAAAHREKQDAGAV